MLSINHLYKNFAKTQVLKDIHLELNIGKTIAIVGANGSGKSTLMKCILGLCKPSQGDITFNSNNEVIESYKTYLGYMPQFPSFPPTMKVKEVLHLIYSLRKNTLIDNELIRQFHLKEMSHKPIQTLSGGMLQKVSACIAFLFNPTILILDEPTTGLDPISADILKQKIKKEKSNKLIFISSHILSDLDELVDELIYIQEGQILFYDKIEMLRAHTHQQKISDIILAKIKS